MKVKVDTETIKHEYENNPVSNKEIGDNHNVSGAYVGQLAQIHGWKKCARVTEKPKEQIMTDDIAMPAYTPSDKKSDLLANMTIDMAERMVNELHCYTPIIGQIEEWIIEATSEDANDRRRNVMMKAVSFSQRAKDLQVLANILVQTRGVIFPAGAVAEGKKAEAQVRATDAAKGKFAPAAPPLRIAK